MPEDKPESSFVSPKDAFEWSYFLLSLHAICLMPFLRSGWGSSKPGIPGAIALIAIPVYASFAESDFMLNYFWMAYIVAVVFRRVESTVRGWLGRRVHSQYEGYPWLTGVFLFWVRDERWLLAAEPLVCVILGVFLIPLDAAFGQFVMLGFGSLAAIECLYRVVERKRRTVARDWRIQMEREAEMQRDLW